MGRLWPGALTITALEVNRPSYSLLEHLNFAKYEFSGFLSSWVRNYSSGLTFPLQPFRCPDPLSRRLRTYIFPCLPYWNPDSPRAEPEDLGLISESRSELISPPCATIAIAFVHVADHTPSFLRAPLWRFHYEESPSTLKYLKSGSSALIYSRASQPTSSNASAFRGKQIIESKKK